MALLHPMVNMAWQWGSAADHCWPWGAIQQAARQWRNNNSNYKTDREPCWSSPCEMRGWPGWEDRPCQSWSNLVGMPSVHLLLSVNDILNKVVEICFDGNRSELLDLLGTQVGVLPHSYQGRERAYAGTFFDNKEFKFFPLQQNFKKIIIYALLSLNFLGIIYAAFPPIYFCPKNWTPPLFSAFRRYSMICYGYHGMLSMTFSGIEIYTTLWNQGSYTCQLKPDCWRTTTAILERKALVSFIKVMILESFKGAMSEIFLNYCCKLILCLPFSLFDFK